MLDVEPRGVRPAVSEMPRNARRRKERGASARHRVAASSSSIPGNTPRNDGSARGLALSLVLLFAENHQQLRIGGENLPQSVLKPAAGLDPLADVIHPLFGNPFDPAFPIRHECQEPDGMPLTRSAMAGGVAAGAMGGRGEGGAQRL